MTNKQLILFGIAALVVLAAIGVTVSLTRQTQDPRSQAQTPGETCTVPGTIQNVQIDYPNCEGQTCSETQANCTWDALSDATSYKVVVTDVNTNIIVQTQTVSTSVTKLVFPVTQGNTYRCDVSAINACGEGTAGTTSLVCSIDLVLTLTPSPTPTVTVPVVATRSPTPTLPLGITPITQITQPPPPPLPPSGTIENTVIFGAGAVAAVIIGSFFFLW